MIILFLSESYISQILPPQIVIRPTVFQRVYLLSVSTGIFSNMKLSIFSVAVLLVSLLEPSLCLPPLRDDPLPDTPNSFGAIYKGSHEGNANTYAETDTDSRGFGSSNMQAGLQGSGKLSGSVLTGGPGGNKAAGSYFGDMEGQGTMTADTQSISTDEGSYSRTSTKGLLTGSGSFGGGSSAGSTDFTWRK